MLKVIVPVSGGKDSQASLQLALEHYTRDEVIGLFCDTQFEHPMTYAHVDKMRDMYGVRIDVVNAGSVEEQCYKHRRFPSWSTRFCTEELKIRPTKRYCKAMAEKLGHGFEVWYGMRTDESTQREKRYAGKVCDELYPPHEVMSKYPKYLAKMGVMFRLAILDWTDSEVMMYLRGTHNPLYDAGFDRVGCFPCLAAGDGPKRKAFMHDGFGRDQYRKVLWISELINKDVFTNTDNHQGCAICSI